MKYVVMTAILMINVLMGFYFKPVSDFSKLLIGTGLSEDGFTNNFEIIDLESPSEQLCQFPEWSISHVNFKS
jgi:hypothetical protein